MNGAPQALHSWLLLGQSAELLSFRFWGVDHNPYMHGSWCWPAASGRLSAAGRRWRAARGAGRQRAFG